LATLRPLRIGCWLLIALALGFVVLRLAGVW
jgi:hypothetical protein